MVDDFPNPTEEQANFDELLNLPEPLQPVVRWLRHQPPVSVAQLQEQVGEAADAGAMVKDLKERGLLEELPPSAVGGEPHYQLRLRGRRSSLKKDIWQSLGDPENE